MEEVLLEDIRKAFLDANYYRNITIPQLDAIMAKVVKYGEFKYDAGIEWANDQAYYSRDND